MPLLLEVAQMRAAEQEAIRRGISSDQLMDRAGRSTAQFALRHLAEPQGASVVVLCGDGNNGGDGLVAASHLSESGCRVRVFQVGTGRKNKAKREALRQAGVEVEPTESPEDREGLAEAVRRADVFIDAVLGTGANLPLRDPSAIVLRSLRDVLKAADRRRPFILAVDCPSGLDCDSGAVADETIMADQTVTFGAVKQGLIRFPGAAFVGMLEVADIGLPADLECLKGIGHEWVDRRLIQRWLPRRPRDAHKGTFGSVIVIGGSISYPGAPLLSALGAYRSGCGLVSIAAPETVLRAMAAQLPEATWTILPAKTGVISEGAEDILVLEESKFGSAVIGPGLAQEKTTGLFLRNFLFGIAAHRMPLGFGKPDAASEKDISVRKLPPLVVDADALKLLSHIECWWERLSAGSVLTPHPGEMAVLTGLDKEEIQKNRSSIAKIYAEKWKAVVVLKGAFTVIAAPDGRVAVEPFATPALSRAGTGDVLSGIIGGLIAQGLDSWRAAVLGAYLHGRAGELAAVTVHDPASVLAGEIAGEISRAIAELRDDG